MTVNEEFLLNALNRILNGDLVNTFKIVMSMNDDKLTAKDE